MWNSFGSDEFRRGAGGWGRVPVGGTSGHENVIRWSFDCCFFLLLLLSALPFVGGGLSTESNGIDCQQRCALCAPS